MSIGICLANRPQRVRGLRVLDVQRTHLDFSGQMPDQRLFLAVIFLPASNRLRF